MVEEIEVEEFQRHADESDRASATEATTTADGIDRIRVEAARRAARYAPREDGECACGCGNEVDPRRLALGYGLTLECAERLDSSGPRR